MLYSIKVCFQGFARIKNSFLNFIRFVNHMHIIRLEIWVLSTDRENLIKYWFKKNVLVECFIKMNSWEILEEEWSWNYNSLFAFLHSWNKSQREVSKHLVLSSSAEEAENARNLNFPTFSVGPWDSFCFYKESYCLFFPGKSQKSWKIYPP